MLTESAKSHSGSSGRESQKSLSHRPNHVLHRGKRPKKGFRTVQETVLGVKHFGQLGCFDSCTRAADSQTKMGFISRQQAQGYASFYCNLGLPSTTVWVGKVLRPISGASFRARGSKPVLYVGRPAGFQHKCTKRSGCWQAPNRSGGGSI